MNIHPKRRLNRENWNFAYGEHPAKKIPYRIAGHAARAAQYRAIYHLKEEFEVKAMCEFFAVSRSPYYEWIRRPDTPDLDQEHLEQVQAVYETSPRIYGYRRITLDLQQNQRVCINHKACYKLNTLSVALKPKLYKKLEETSTYHKYPNLLNRNFAATRPKQK